MNFASPIFLFAFLPLVLIAYHLLRPIREKNVLLIAAGLVFYAFGDLRHLPLLLASCALHYGVGLALMRARRGRRLLLAACVTVDLAVLAAYKWRGALPLGISFYTFQAISYIVDVSRAPQSGTRSFRRALQYLTFFPQLTAGPLMRFSEVPPEITDLKTCKTRVLQRVTWAESDDNTQMVPGRTEFLTVGKPATPEELLHWLTGTTLANL